MAIVADNPVSDSDTVLKTLKNVWVKVVKIIDEVKEIGSGFIKSLNNKISEDWGQLTAQHFTYRGYLKALSREKYFRRMEYMKKHRKKRKKPANRKNKRKQRRNRGHEQERHGYYQN